MRHVWVHFYFCHNPISTQPKFIKSWFWHENDFTPAPPTTTHHTHWASAISVYCHFQKIHKDVPLSNNQTPWTFCHMHTYMLGATYKTDCIARKPWLKSIIWLTVKQCHVCAGSPGIITWCCYILKSKISMKN